MACAVTFREVPRQGSHEVREYLGTATRAPFAEVAVDTAPVEVWRAEAGRGSLGLPAVGDRVTVVATVDRWVYAISTRTGDLFWRFRGDNSYAAGPVTSDGRVFVASEGRDGRLTAIDLYSGKRLWHGGVGDVAGPLTYRDGTVFGANQRGAVFAYDASSGARRWVYYGAPGRSGPLVHDSLVVLATMSDLLVILHTRTGAALTRARLPASTLAPLALVDDSTVAMSAPSGSILAVAIPSGVVRWQVATGAPVYGAPAVVGDSVFALTNDCVLWTIPAWEPARASSSALGCRTVATPALSRGGVVVATVGGDLVYFDRITKRRIWTRHIGGELRHPPILRNGQIIVAPVLGSVVSLR